MKWTENGVTFEGTPAEYRELHAAGLFCQPKRTRRGKHVTVEYEDTAKGFQTISDAAEWISQKTGRYVSASKLSKMIDERGCVDLERFQSGSANLFENNQPKGTEENDK